MGLNGEEEPSRGVAVAGEQGGEWVLLSPEAVGLEGGPQLWESAAPQPMTAPRCCLWDKHPSLPTHLDKAGKCSHEDLSQGPPPGSHPTSLQTMVTELTTGACLGLRDPHPHEGGPAAPRPEEGLRHPPSPRPNRVPEKGNCCHLYPSILAPMPFLSGEPGALSQMGNHGLQGSRRPGPPGGMGEPRWGGGTPEGSGGWGVSKVGEAGDPG